MPQMAPLSWSLLFSFFSITFIFSMIMIFYLFSYQVPFNFPLLLKKKNPIWKW